MKYQYFLLHILESFNTTKTGEAESLLCEIRNSITNTKNSDQSLLNLQKYVFSNYKLNILMSEEYSKEVKLF